MPRKRILIVDDDEDIREIASLSFELTAAWDVTSASSGAEGIAAALAVHPDLILLDVMMPELDGPGTLCELRSDPRTESIPVIFLTAKVQTADRRRYLSLGVQGVISKPFDPLMLPGEVEAAVEAHRSLQSE